jgi:hypothetical protein
MPHVTLLHCPELWQLPKNAPDRGSQQRERHVSDIQKVREQLKNVRKRANEAERGLVRKTTLGISGAALAYAEKKGAPLAVFGVPTKLAIGAAATMIEAMSNGSTARFAGAIADSALAIYSYEATKKGSFIAGLTAVGDDEDGDEI